jgi:hypothetical protein
MFVATVFYKHQVGGLKMPFVDRFEQRFTTALGLMDDVVVLDASFYALSCTGASEAELSAGAVNLAALKFAKVRKSVDRSSERIGLFITGSMRLYTQHVNGHNMYF